ncbi:hypothetical protein BHE74_00051159 [Ensete ventricosum]|nr:hypothetical protein BHE74_00051159 [Ensete ventricosum]
MIETPTRSNCVLFGSPAVQVHDLGHGLLGALGSLRRSLPSSPPPIDGGRYPVGLRERRNAVLGTVVEGPQRVVPPAQPRLVLERFHRRHARCDDQRNSVLGTNSIASVTRRSQIPQSQARLTMFDEMTSDQLNPADAMVQLTASCRAFKLKSAATAEKSSTKKKKSMCKARDCRWEATFRSVQKKRAGKMQDEARDEQQSPDGAPGNAAAALFGGERKRKGTVVVREKERAEMAMQLILWGPT